MLSQRVLIVSPNELFGQGLQHLIASWEDVEVVGVAASLEEAERLAETARPQVVIVDYQADPVLWQTCLERFFRQQGSVERVVLLTLAVEGHRAVVYHRFACPAEAVETWLFGGGERA